MLYRMAAINPEFYKYFKKLAQHHWKSSNFSGDHSLDPGLAPLECLRHGVPVEGPITSLIFRIRSSVLLWGFALAINLETPNKKLSKRLQSGELGGQYFLVIHLQEGLRERVLHSLDCLWYKLTSPNNISFFASSPLTPSFSHLY